MRRAMPVLLLTKADNKNRKTLKNPSVDGFNIVKTSFSLLLLSCEKGSDVILVDDLL